MESKFKNLTKGDLFYDVKNNLIIEIIKTYLPHKRTLVLLGYENDEPILTFKNNINLQSNNFIFLDINIHRICNRKINIKATRESKFPSWTIKKIKATGMYKYACYKTALFNVGDEHYIYAYSLKQKAKNREK